jgi:hypothetical protein
MPSQRGGPNGNAARTRDGRTLATSSGLEVREHMTPGADPEHGQAADLLSKWRAAERDTIAAKEAAQVASLAHRAATAAETSAVETEEAAVSAAEVVDLARVGAMKARKAASAAAAAAHMAIAVPRATRCGPPLTLRSRKPQRTRPAKRFGLRSSGASPRTHERQPLWIEVIT